MPFNQNGPDASADVGNYSDIQRDQDNKFIRAIVHGQNQTYQADTIIINIRSDSVAESSAQRTFQPVAGPSNEAPSVAVQCPLQSWQRKVIAAVDDTSRLIISIVRLLANRMESFDSCRDLKLSLELLFHTIVMSRLAALEIVEPRSSDLASTVEPAILECLGSLRELFVKLQAYQEGHGVTSIPWNNTPRRFQRQELCRMKKRLETHQVALMEFLALNSYVRYPYR